MRAHFWHFLVDSDGIPISGADITICLAGSDTPAYVYLDELGGAASNADPQVVTTTEGFFEFWIADNSEVSGYSAGQKFKIKWSKIGISSGYIDYVDVFPVTVEVNEYDEDPVKNKTISNLLAYQWETHRLNQTHKVHGIEEVDVTGSDTTLNKLVSDNLARTWDEHATYSFALSGSSTGHPHGLAPVDITNSLGTEINKVISDQMAYDWETHRNETYETTPHGLVEADPTSDDTTPNKLVSNHMLKSLVAVNTVHKYTDSILSGSWTLSGGYYLVDITHDLDNSFPIINVYDALTLTKINLHEIYSTGMNTLRLVNLTNPAINITAIG